MSKSILLFVLSLFSIVSVYGGDIRLPAKGGGLYQVVIVDRGSKGAKYDGVTGAIVNTSHGTKIAVRDIDFGNERYGWYNQFMIEYTNPSNCTDAYFDIYIEDTTVPVASIPVEQTEEGEYKETLASLKLNIIGSHAVYIRWRNHSANLKTFGANALVPFASVSLVRTGSLTKYKFNVGDLESLTGKHRLKMVWRKNNATVANVYLDSNNPASVEKVYEEDVHAYGVKGGIKIESSNTIGEIWVSSLTGLRMKEFVSLGTSEYIALPSGFYLLRIIPDNGKTIVCKVLVRD